MTVEVRAAKSTRTLAAYGTIVNPNVAKLLIAPTSVLGERDHPTGLVLSGVKAPQVGSYLTSGPNAALPIGLVSKVTTVRIKGTTATVGVKAAAISEVAPEVTYAGAVSLHEVPSANVASSPPCGIGSGLALTGGMKITGIGIAGLQGSVWPLPRLAFNTTTGLAGNAGWSSSASASCEADDTLATWTGVIPGLGIPVFAQPKLALSGSVSAATTNGFEARTTLVTSFDSRPARVSLGLAGSSASLTGTHAGIAAEVSLGLYMEVGIGVPDIAGIPIALNFHATLGAALAFTAEPSNPVPEDRCLVHAKLGSLEVGLTGGPFSLTLASFSGLDQPIKAFNCGTAGGGGTGGSGGGGPGGTGVAPGGETSTALSIATGWFTTCAVLSDRNGKCWGEDGDGELGNGLQGPGASLYAPAAYTIPVGEPLEQLASGLFHTCALSVAGNVKCWGDNSFSELGDSNAETEPTPPASFVDLGGPAQQIAEGDMNSCALMQTGDVECWGNEAAAHGGAGHALTTPPTPANLGARATQVSMGSTSTCALLTGGTVTCWGGNLYGQLGYGDHEGREPQPTLHIHLGEPATQIATGEQFNCALLSSGSVKCWGDNQYGQLGYGDTSERSAPANESVPLGEAVAQIAAGQFHTCALLVSGSIKCWGDNYFGQLGYGDDLERDAPSIETVALGGPAIRISAGGSHTCALLANSQMKCWGYGGGESNFGDDFGGALGYGDTASRMAPPSEVIDLSG